MNIFKYTNYVKYLSDLYENMKHQNRFFSYEQIAKKLELKSKGAVHNIFKGKRGISGSTIYKLNQLLKHNSSESRYFELMVAFSKANTGKEKDGIYQEMLKQRKRYLKDWFPQVISEEQYEYYSKYYYSIIRSLIGLYRFKDDFEWLAKNVKPRITPTQARQAIALLEKLNFIKKDKTGYYQLEQKSISTEKEVANLTLLNYHQTMGQLALKTMADLPKNLRNIQGATLGISEKGYKKICEEMIRFRENLQKIAEEDEGADRVYRMNLQFFPVSSDKIQGEIK